jgi:hypothetical protein
MGFLDVSIDSWSLWSWELGQVLVFIEQSSTGLDSTHPTQSHKVKRHTLTCPLSFLGHLVLPLVRIAPPRWGYANLWNVRGGAMRAAGVAAPL